MKINHIILSFFIFSMPLIIAFQPPVNVRVSVNSKELVETIDALADHTGPIVAKIVSGLGTGSKEGLPHFFKEVGDGIGDGMPSIRDGIQRGTDELFDPESGYMGHVLNQLIDNGNSFQSKLFSQIIFPGAAKGVAVIGGAFITLGLIRMGLTLGSKYLDHYLFKPTVISEYSIQRWYSRYLGQKQTEMILHHLVKDRLEGLIFETQNTFKQIRAGNKQIKFSNILLSGAPGTGKTMFAKKLAYESGMSYAFVSASAFFQEGAGIGAIKDLFAWAKRTKGLVLFIDEADALFVEREKLKSDSDQYKIVCEFLTHLGEKSDNFMLVMATNHPVVFDEAMQSRIDDVIEIPLPDQKMREQILELYTESILCNATNGSAFVKSARQYMNAAERVYIATQCDGLSNRDLHAIVNKIAKKSLVGKSGLVTTEMIRQTVEDYLQKQHIFSV